MKDINRYRSDHPDGFLLREQREIGELAYELGPRVAGKLDQLLTRELLRDRRQSAMHRMFGIREPERRYRVAMTMRGARYAQPAARSAEWHADRRKIWRDLQTSARLSVGRLTDDMAQRGVDVIGTYWIAHTAVADVTLEQLRALAAREDVASVVIVKEHLMTSLDGSRHLINADKVQASGITGTGVTVAVVDTGVDAAHVALAGVVTSQTDLTGSGGATAEGIGDMVGHGTHCAGIVASQDGTFRGIAPGATITDIKIMRNDGAGGGTGSLASALAGIQQATTTAQVASCSWGFSHQDGKWQDPPAAGAADGTCAICTAVDNAVTAGLVVVVAAGNNDNDSCSTWDTHLDCPGLARNAITVAASSKSDSMADFSSVGPTPDGRAKPDITAPGVDIGSCRAAGTSMGNPIDANFTRADGTSMATPHVAGVAALMISRTAAITPATVKTNLMLTAVDLGAPSIQEGTGRVDAAAAVSIS